jgi:hypothetical protein
MLSPDDKSPGEVARWAADRLSGRGLARDDHRASARDLVQPVRRRCGPIPSHRERGRDPVPRLPGGGPSHRARGDRTDRRRDPSGHGYSAGLDDARPGPLRGRRVVGDLGMAGDGRLPRPWSATRVHHLLPVGSDLDRARRTSHRTGPPWQGAVRRSDPGRVHLRQVLADRAAPVIAGAATMESAPLVRRRPSPGDRDVGVVGWLVRAGPGSHLSPRPRLARAELGRQPRGHRLGAHAAGAGDLARGLGPPCGLCRCCSPA